MQHKSKRFTPSKRFTRRNRRFTSRYATRPLRIKRETNSANPFFLSTPPVHFVGKNMRSILLLMALFIIFIAVDSMIDNQNQKRIKEEIRSFCRNDCRGYLGSGGFSDWSECLVYCNLHCGQICGGSFWDSRIDHKCDVRRLCSASINYDEYREKQDR